MNSGIYKITSPSGKFYIGSSKNIKKRWRSHRSELSRGKHANKALQRAFNKYGNLDFEVIIICRFEDLLLYEQIAIDGLLPDYNVLRVAGRLDGYRHSDETRRRLSESHKGRKLPPEQRAKIGKASREFFAMNPEVVERIRLVHVGKVVSKETRHKMAEARRKSFLRPGVMEAAVKRMSGENSPVAIHSWEKIRAIRAEFDSANGRRGIQKELCQKYCCRSCFDERHSQPKNLGGINGR